MTPYETPAFDPGTAFSWTLRSAEIARRTRDRAQSTNGARYEAPAFDPGTAFSWTLRSAEIARRECQRRNRQPDLDPRNALIAA